MCLNIKFIPSRSKFISPYYRERYLMPCKCGFCAECQAEKHAEWYYRIYSEWLSAMEQGNYVFFGTLTYSNEFLPHISEFFDDSIPDYYEYEDSNGKKHKYRLNVPCFCYDDVTKFKKRLLTNLERKGYDVRYNLRFFICSEYGTSDEYNYKGTIRKATHRPHYHLLAFAPSSLPVEVLRDQIDKEWFFGRTDSLRKSGEKANYFPSSSETTKLAVSNYVAKYVQKVSLFQSTINKRVDIILKYLYSSKFDYIQPTKVEFDYDRDISLPRKFFSSNKVLEYKTKFDEDGYLSWCRSESGKKYKRDVMRLVNQFHRQSTGFGMSALRDVDLNDVMENGYLVMPDKEKVIRKIPLPKYYERKLFEEQILVDGHKMWQPTKLGLEYREKKQDRLHKYLSGRYQSLMDEYNYHPDGISSEQLSNYTLFYKGRINGSFFSLPTLEDKLSLGDCFYNYVTSCDKLQFRQALVSYDYHGMSGNYDTEHLDNCISVSEFIYRYTIHEDDVGCSGYDAVLERLSALQLESNRAKQKAYNQRQLLKNKYKMRCKEHI